MAANPNTSGNVRQLLTDLEDVLTEEVLSSDVLTGDYYISDVNEGSKKVTEITLYANTKGKMQRKNAVKSFLGVVEDSILNVPQRGLSVDTVLHDKKGVFTTGALDVSVYWLNNKGKKGGEQILRYGIKPAANAKDNLYHVLAQECLQVLACAMRQAKGRNITVEEFKDYLNYADDVAANKRKADSDAEKQSWMKSIEQHTDYGDKANRQIPDIYAFGLGDDEWIQSSVTTANKLEDLYGTGDYFFCHADSKVVSWYWKAFEDAREQVLLHGDVFGKDITKGLLDRNKWNPADMFALQVSEKTGYKFPTLKNRAKKETGAITEREILTHMRMSGNKKSATIDVGEAITKKAENANTVEGMPSLNLFLLNLSKDKKFYPISLKKVGTNATLDWINDTTVPVTFEAELEPDGVKWKDDFRGNPTNKVEVHFKIKVGNDMKDYYINARQFNEGADIKLQIEKTGGMAFHGKIGLKLSSFIINKTDPAMKNSIKVIRNSTKTIHKDFKVASDLFSDIPSIKSNYKKKKLMLEDYVKVLSDGGVTKMPPTETGYISKVQATEFGHIINSSKERGLSSYILYSLFTYAGSRGLVLFDGNSYKNHYASSLHIKVM